MKSKLFKVACLFAFSSCLVAFADVSCDSAMRIAKQSTASESCGIHLQVENDVEGPIYSKNGDFAISGNKLTTRCGKINSSQEAITVKASIGCADVKENLVNCQGKLKSQQDC